MEAGDAVPPFSTAAVAGSTERTRRMLESDHLHTGPIDQGGAAGSALEKGQIAGNSGASPCSYCERNLLGIRWYTLCGHLFRASVESKCMTAA